MTDEAKQEQTGVNDSRTNAGADTRLTQQRSGPVRYRLREDDGRAYAPFRLKPGVTIGRFLAALPGQEDLELEQM